MDEQEFGGEDSAMAAMEGDGRTDRRAAGQHFQGGCLCLSRLAWECLEFTEAKVLFYTFLEFLKIIRIYLYRHQTCLFQGRQHEREQENFWTEEVHPHIDNSGEGTANFSVSIWLCHSYPQRHISFRSHEGIISNHKWQTNKQCQYQCQTNKQCQFQCQY